MRPEVEQKKQVKSPKETEKTYITQQETLPASGQRSGHSPPTEHMEEELGIGQEKPEAEENNHFRDAIWFY